MVFQKVLCSYAWWGSRRLKPVKGPWRLEPHFARYLQPRGASHGSSIDWSFRTWRRSWLWCHMLELTCLICILKKFASLPKGFECNSSTFFSNNFAFSYLFSEPLISRRGHSAAVGWRSLHCWGHWGEWQRPSRRWLGDHWEKYLCWDSELQSWLVPCPWISPSLWGPQGSN